MVQGYHLLLLAEVRHKIQMFQGHSLIKLVVLVAAVADLQLQPHNLVGKDMLDKDTTEGHVPKKHFHIQEQAAAELDQ